MEAHSRCVMCLLTLSDTKRKRSQEEEEKKEKKKRVPFTKKPP